MAGLLAVLVILSVFFGILNAGRGTGFLCALNFSSAVLCFCSFLKVVLA